MNPRQLKQNLIKLKRDAVQLQNFGEIINTFCCIKNDVENGVIDTMMVSEYISCFKDLAKYMIDKWVSDSIVKDVKLIK